MARKKPNYNGYVSHLEQMEKRNKAAFREYIQVIQTFGKSFVDSLKFSPPGLFVNPENRSAMRNLQKQIINVSNRFIVDVYGSFDWQQAYLDGKNPELPLSMNGQAMLKAARIAREVMQYTSYGGLPILQEQLNSSIDASRTMTLGVKTNLMTFVNQQMRKELPKARDFRKGGSVADLYEYIKTYGNEEAQRYAETIARGTILGAYRGVLDGIGKEIEADHVKVTGPFPLQEDAGHVICQEFYQRVVTYEEVEDFIRSNRKDCAADGIESIDDFRQWCGGYNCRHTATPINPVLLKYAKEDEQENLDRYAADKEDPEINIHMEGRE